MKLNQKAQHLIEYMLLMAAVVAGVLGVTSPGGPMHNAVDRSLNRAVETIYGDYFWKLGVATPCSVLPGCGNGTQTRTVVCSNGTGDVVADGLCAGKGPKPLTTIDCNISCGGFAWWQSGFGACSAACGPGTQSQMVECRDAGGITVADALCGGGRPPDSVPCDNGCFAWVAGTTCTGLCSEPCGVGTCSRSVVCQDTRTSMTVADANCTGPKPGPTIACNTAITCGYQWVVDDWGNCDQACGDGFKHRLVQCRRLADNVVVPDANCGLPATKPADQLACNLGPCNHWGVVGDWTPCTKPCGTGDQDGNIVCLDRNNVVQGDAPCLAEAGPKPASNRPCNTGACTWGTSAYGACSTTCGSGIKTRNVWCYQWGFAVPHLDIAWCGGVPPVPGGAANCSDAPANTICTQNDTCNDTSTCCGNGVVNNFPAIPYSEQCDLGAANNGPCDKLCSAGCTNNFCCTPNAWVPGSCGGGVCSAIQREQTRTCSGPSCGSDCGGAGVSQCVADAVCNSCTPGGWVPGACGGGSCPAAQREQTRVCSGGACGSNCGGLGLTQCVADASCNTCTPGSWVPGSCGGGGCPAIQRQETRTCVGPACGSDCGGLGISHCVADATCNSCTPGSWVPGSCGGGGCPAAQRQETRTCVGAGCGSDCGGAGVSHCVADPTCTSCTPGSWVSGSCGGGTCPATQMQETRVCVGPGCGADCGGAGLTRCVANPSCAAVTCTLPVGSSWTGPETCTSDANVTIADGATIWTCDVTDPTIGCKRWRCDGGSITTLTNYCNWNCTMNSWVNGACGGGSCSASQREQTRTCFGGGCGSDCHGQPTSQCVADATCNVVTCTFAAGAAWTDSGTGLTCNNSGGDITVNAGNSGTATDSSGTTRGSITATCTPAGTWNVTAVSCNCGGGTTQFGAGCYPWCVCESCAANGWNCGQTNCRQSCGSCGNPAMFQCFDHRCECWIC